MVSDSPLERPGETESAAARRFIEVSCAAVLRPPPGCEHLRAEALAFFCLCCPTAARCLECHTSHLTDVCPLCGGTLDEARHEIVHGQPRSGDLANGLVPAGKIVHGYVCVSCALDNDLTQLPE